jgi:hypothetical protein
MQTVIRKETQRVTENAGPGELKIPDETFRNRNGGTNSHTGAMSLRTKAAISGTARNGAGAAMRIRPFELYFFGAFAAPGGLVAPDLFASSVRPRCCRIYDQG